jgi:hypothetical protein
MLVIHSPINQKDFFSVVVPLFILVFSAMGSLCLLLRLVTNSCTQEILPLCPPELLGLQTPLCPALQGFLYYAFHYGIHKY